MGVARAVGKAVGGVGRGLGGGGRGVQCTGAGSGQGSECLSLCAPSQPPASPSTQEAIQGMLSMANLQASDSCLQSAWGPGQAKGGSLAAHGSRKNGAGGKSGGKRLLKRAAKNSVDLDDFEEQDHLDACFKDSDYGEPPWRGPHPSRAGAAPSACVAQWWLIHLGGVPPSLQTTCEPVAPPGGQPVAPPPPGDSLHPPGGLPAPLPQPPVATALPCLPCVLDTSSPYPALLGHLCPASLLTMLFRIHLGRPPSGAMAPPPAGPPQSPEALLSATWEETQERASQSPWNMAC